MKVKVLQENLANSLSTVSRVVGSGTNLPILENILLSAEEKGLIVSATDLETGISVRVPAKVEQKGKLTLPAKKITQFIASLPAENVSLEKKGEKLEVECQNFEATFNGISAEEFPELPSLKNKKKLENVEVFKMDSAVFISAIEKVVFAAAVDESRPVLNGVRISSEENGLQMVATDGYRLSIETIKMEDKIRLPELLVPGKALKELIRIFPSDKEFKIALTSRENQVIFEFEDIEIVTRLIEGEFPQFEKIIPEEGKTKVVIDKEPLERAIRATAIFARESANIMKMESDEQKIYISSNAAQVGKNKIEIEVEKEGPEFEIAFNWRFLQDFLNIIESEKVNFEFSGSLKPGIFRSQKDKDFLHVIMPVRIQD